MANHVTVTPTNHGPYHIIGNVQLVLPGGRVIATEGEIWLCRCGHSKDKPFCDGSHTKAAFKAQDGDETAHKG